MIYIINIGLIVFWAALFFSINIKNPRRLYTIFVCLQLILIAGLRSVDVGNDTINYNYTFETAKNMNFSQIINFYDKDYGYYLFNWLMAQVLPNFQLFLILVAILSISSVGYFIYKNSAQPFMSFLIFVSLFFNFFMTGTRQTLAISLLLVGFEFCKKRKIFLFVVIVLLATTFHQSALLFLPFYFITLKRITSLYTGIVAMLLPIAFIFKNNILSFLQTIGGYEQYVNYEGAGTHTFTFMMILIFIVVIIKKKDILLRKPVTSYYLHAFYLAFLLIPLTYINPSLLRLVMYFNIYIILIIPEIIESFKGKEKIIIYYTAILVLLGLYLRSIPNYEFFWQ